MATSNQRRESPRLFTGLVNFMPPNWISILSSKNQAKYFFYFQDFKLVFGLSVALLLCAGVDNSPVGNFGDLVKTIKSDDNQVEAKSYDNADQGVKIKRNVVKDIIVNDDTQDENSGVDVVDRAIILQDDGTEIVRNVDNGVKDARGESPSHKSVPDIAQDRTLLQVWEC